MNQFINGLIALAALGLVALGSLLWVNRSADHDILVDWRDTGIAGDPPGQADYPDIESWPVCVEDVQVLDGAS